MARKDIAQKADEAADAPARRHRVRRYCVAMLLAGVVVLLWLSLLTFSPTDPPSVYQYYQHPARANADNAVGLVGSHLAYFLRYWIGGGAYVGLALLTAAVGRMLLGRTISDLPWRVTGAVLLVAATSASLYLYSPHVSIELAESLPGILGLGIGRFFLQRFSTMGSVILLSVTFCIGAILAADHALLSLVKALWSLLQGRRPFVSDGSLAAATAAVAEKPATRYKPPQAASRPSPRAEAKAAAAAAKAEADADAQNAEAEEAPKATPSRLSALLPFGKGKKAMDEVEEEDVEDGEEAEGIAPRPAPPTPAKAAPAPAARPRPEPRKPAPAPVSKDGFQLPPVDLLEVSKGGFNETAEQQAAQRQMVLQQTLTDFNVQATVVGYETGPVITLFEVSLSPGVKVSTIAGLATDVARALAVPGVRIVPPRFGKDTIGIEVPNLEKETVRIRDLMDLAPSASQKQALPLYLGKDAGGGPIVADLASMPHMLIAGTTGSGKSVCINTIIMSLLMHRTPQEVRLILVDPKMVEMAAFERIPHLLCPVVSDMRHAESILEWAATKMDERYELLKEANVKNIAGFNKLSPEEIYKRFGAEDEDEQRRIPTRLPYYVIIIDELADLIMTSEKEVEGHIIRIAQKARAVGIHLILATQRPSANVVTGLIKSNMPCRVSFRVASRQESRIVLDQNGAEVLLGRGDMLFLQPGSSSLVRSQGTYVDDSEIQQVVAAIRATGEPEYNTELVRMGSSPSGETSGEKDDMFDQAVEIVLQQQRGSVSLLQRRLQVGYTRASRIIDQMAEAGILGDYKGSQARECLMTLEDWQIFKSSLDADQSGSSAANGEPMSV